MPGACPLPLEAEWVSMEVFNLVPRAGDFNLCVMPGAQNLPSDHTKGRAGAHPKHDLYSIIRSEARMTSRQPRCAFEKGKKNGLEDG